MSRQTASAIPDAHSGRVRAGSVIVLTGGGSGGHITPLLAVAAELKQQKPDCRIVYIGQRGDYFGDLVAKDANIDEAHVIFAGKFRRYHGEGLRQLLDVPTLLKNLRDVFLVALGIIQSRRLMGLIRPGVVFSRGGYVSVPVCLGAALRHIPYITHDSDSVPSLANRLIARWARLHAVAMPAETYPYPRDKTVSTGIPLREEFKPVSAPLRKRYRQDIKIPQEGRLLFVIGGGLGSQTINGAVAEVLPHLLHDFPDLQVVHMVGRSNEDHMKQTYISSLPIEEQGRVQVMGFMPDVYRYSGAADIIVSRAGATNLAEFAVQGKACVIIPSSFLTGGHQLKSASYLEEHDAALVLGEAELAEDPNRLAKQIATLLRDPGRLDALGSNLSGLAKPHAARTITKLILEVAGEAAA